MKKGNGKQVTRIFFGVLLLLAGALLLLYNLCFISGGYDWGLGMLDLLLSLGGLLLTVFAAGDLKRGL